MARLRYEIDAAYEAEIKRRCWSPWQRASDFVDKLLTLIKFLVFIGGVVFAWNWFPHTIAGENNQFVYWGGFVCIASVYWQFLNLLAGATNLATGDRHSETPDPVRALMSPVGKHVWDNLLEYEVISNIVAHKLRK